MDSVFMWIGGNIMPLVSTAQTYFLWAAFLVFLPLAFFRKSRGAAGFYFSIVGLIVLGIHLWLSSLLTTWDIWALWGTIIGLLIAGIGVIPIAFLASILKGNTQALLELVTMASILTAFWFFGRSLVRSHDNYTENMQEKIKLR